MVGTQLLVAMVVFAVIVALMLLNAFAPPKPKAAPKPDAVPQGLVARFVTHQGSVVGEVVAVEDGRLVLKQAGKFRVVAQSLLKESDGELRLEGDIDWVRADIEGGLWHERNRKHAESDVTGGRLTTSADVRSPALDALQREKGP